MNLLKNPILQGKDIFENEMHSIIISYDEDQSPIMSQHPAVQSTVNDELV